MHAKWTRLFLAGALVFGAGTAARADEAGAAKAYAEAKLAGETSLVAFFNRFPKGADLHNHLTGAIFAESYIEWAKEGGMCIDPAGYAFSTPAAGAPCKAPQVSVSDFLRQSDGYETIVNALSMRDGPLGGVKGHDHFFAAFAKFGAVAGDRFADSVARLERRADRENVAHLELMATPDMGYGKKLAGRLTWSGDFRQMRAQLERAGLMQDVREAAKNLDRTMTDLGCRPNVAAPKCPVTVGFLFQISRGAKLEDVFTKAVFGAELAKVSPWVYGINIVAPEDGQVALRDYDAHMHIIAFADKDVHRALHAGELTVALVPPEDLQDHVRQAVEVAHAERIGHGSDIAWEKNAPALMREMAQKGVAVELALTSNQQILGLDAGSSPFSLYRRAGVPIVLATDDPGIERTTLSREYAKAAGWFDLDYADFKKLSVDSLRYSFLPGAEIWEPGTNRLVAACRESLSSPHCDAFAKENRKAGAERDLLRRFVRFEADF